MEKLPLFEDFNPINESKVYHPMDDDKIPKSWDEDQLDDGYLIYYVDSEVVAKEPDYGPHAISGTSEYKVTLAAVDQAEAEKYVRDILNNRYHPKAPITTKITDVKEVGVMPISYKDSDWPVFDVYYSVKVYYN
jgi:hypothetical protein